MAWGKDGRPTWKYCLGYGDRGPHRMLYEDFPKQWRILKNGRKTFYAGSRCRDCRNAYERELRRMNNRLEGRATRPQDVPWKKYRKRQDETWVRGLNALATQVPSEPFFKWLDNWMAKRHLSLEQVCRGTGVSSRTVRRWRRQGHLQLHSAEKFFIYAKMPHISSVMYPPEKRAA